MRFRLNRKSRGQTLVEVAVGVIIAAMTSVAVFSVILSGTVSQKKADKREAAAAVLAHAQGTLKAYVSAVPTEGTYTPGLPVGHWSAEPGAAWALAPGAHDITSILTGGPLAGGTFTYNVTNYNCGFGIAVPCKTVVFTLTYPD